MDLAFNLGLTLMQVVGAVAIALVSTILYLVIYRLVLSPAAKFPGPKLAGLTFWYEFYYDVVLGGKYVFKIRELHDKYGPIVRINPEELHVDDPAFFPKLFSGQSERRDKWPWSMTLFGMSAATFSTIPHDLHRRRRAALNPFFSKAVVARFEPQLRTLNDRLCQRLREFKETGEPANLGVIFAALSTDVITTYAFGEAYNSLNAPDFNPQLYKAVQANTRNTPVAKQFPWIIPLSRKLPYWAVKAMNPLLMQMVYFAEYIQTKVQNTIDDSQNEGVSSSAPSTVFHGILASDLPPSEKSLPRLIDEGISVVGAGLLSTADTLRVTAFHILNSPDTQSRLKSELESAIPNPDEMPPLKVLEQLPFLSAVINEGYRMASGISGRLQRVSPWAPLAFNDWIIPPGVPVSMNMLLLHYKPDTFPEPNAFRPDRWLNKKKISSKDSNEGDTNEKQSAGDRLENYQVHFGRGARGCVGMNLAQAEIYFALAYLFRRFNMSLYETTRADVDIEHDFFTAFPKLDSQGVRVLVH